jgi:L-seryl-tRNA(Ser) seleniumtransferase
VLEPAASVRRRAERLNEGLGGDLEHAHVHRCESAVGGGSMPETTMASWGVRIIVPEPGAFAARLRAGTPSVFCRVEGDHVLLDARTITEEQVPDAARAVLYAIEGDEFVDED